MPTRALTETFARSANADARTHYWDRQLRGLGLRVAPRRGCGVTKVWVYRYRTRDGGTQREYKIGPYPAITAATARSEVSALTLEVLQGGDPCRRRRNREHSLRVEGLCRRFEAERFPQLADKSRRSYKSKIDTHVLHPRYGLGSMLVSEVERADVQRCVDQVAERRNRKGIRTIGQAKLVRGLLSSLFSFAEEIGAREPNSSPTCGVRINTRREDWELAKIEPIGHTFEESEARAVWDAIGEVGISAAAADCLRLIALTGVRKDEARLLRTRDVVLTGRNPHLLVRRHKTDKKNPIKEIPLVRRAVVLLEAWTSHDSERFVFPSPRDAAKPLGDLWTPWTKVRDKAGLPKARIHDLRGLAACYLKDAGWSEEQICVFMGWESPEMVRRYVRASRSVLREGAEIIELGMTARG